MKGANKYMKNGFYQKNFAWGKWVILGFKMAHPCNSGSALIFF